MNECTHTEVISLLTPSRSLLTLIPMYCLPVLTLSLHYWPEMGDVKPLLSIYYQVLIITY